jgi:hypothetical protein
MSQMQTAVTELELTRVPGDRRLYALDGIGTLRLEGFLGRAALAQAGDARWKIGRRGVWRRELQAIDELGALAGEFLPRAVRRGGSLRWGERELTLQPASSWRERYSLSDGDRELVLLDGKGWGKRPVRLTLRDRTLEPGLLLFATFVVRGLAEDASGSAGAGASTAAIA